MMSMRERWAGSLGMKRKEFLIEEKWVERSRVVLEQKLGRKLRKGEVVHHINEDTTDDRPENLQSMTNSEHVSYHTKKENAYLRFGPQDLENNPAWKGDEASDHAKYMRVWERKRKADGFVRPHRRTRR